MNGKSSSLDIPVAETRPIQPSTRTCLGFLFYHYRGRPTNSSTMSTHTPPDKEKGIAGASPRVASVSMDGDDVAHRLEEMGYKQELQRNLGMVAVLGLSFAIMAVSKPVSAGTPRTGAGWTM